MAAKVIDGWLCARGNDVRIASLGEDSLSYAPGGTLVVTTGATGISKIPVKVFEYLMSGMHFPEVE